MRKRKAKNRERIYIMKAALYDYTEREDEEIYRILTIPEKFSLYELAEAVIESFNFDFDHSFGYYSNKDDYYDSGEGYELFYDIGEPTNYPSGVKRTKVNKVFRKIGKELMLLFDYGDEWKFNIKLIDMEFPSYQEIHPMVTERKGRNPVQYEYPRN